MISALAILREVIANPHNKGGRPKRIFKPSLDGMCKRHNTRKCALGSRSYCEECVIYFRSRYTPKIGRRKPV